MELKLRPDEHLVRDPLVFHVLDGPQAHVSGILVKGAVLLPDDADVPAHGQGGNLRKRVHHRGLRVRDKDHIALLHRGVPVVGAVEADALGENILVKALHWDRDVPPPAV